MKVFFLLAYLFLPTKSFYTTPPTPSEAAYIARNVIHESDWLSISTISTLKNTKGYPFVNLKSMSDGPRSHGKGIPYIYLTDMDLSGKDIEEDNRVTIMVTRAQSNYCKNEKYDSQDPRCARVILSGKVVKVSNTTSEYNFAKTSLFSRHPVMKTWPKDHNFFIAKVDIEQVVVLYHFGGATNVPVDDYLNADSRTEKDVNIEEIAIINIIT